MRKLLVKINIFNTILILILCGIMIVKLDCFTRETVTINLLKKEIEKISKENQKLEEEVLTAGSISNLDQFLEKSDLVKAEKIQFIQIFEGGMVVK